MKGYNLEDSKNAKRFINSYKIKGSKIILHMNNKDTLEYQYSQGAIDQIKNMQNENYNMYNERELKNNIDKIKLKKVYIILFTLSTLVLNAAMIFTNFEYLWAFLGVSSEIALISHVTKGITIQKNIKELKKQKVYESMIDDLDDDILENKNISQCLSNRKISTMNKQRELTGSTFNLTSIDKLSLDELKRLRDNIEREKEFDFEPINKTKQYGM